MSSSDKARFFTAISRSMWEPLYRILELPVRGRAAELEQRVAQLEAEQEVRDLHLAYTYAYDAGDVAGAIKVFDKDCTLVNPRGVYIGIKAIEENYRYLIERRRFAFHNTTNIAVRLSEDGREAAMTAYLLGMSVSHTGQAIGLNGTYIDRLRKTDEGWRIIERRITSNVRYSLMLTPQIVAPAAPPPPGSSPGSSQEWIGDTAII